MSTLWRMLLGSIARVFVVFLLLFVLVFELIDVFSNLWRYLNQEVGLADIVRVGLLYLPKCVSYSLPAALLFATAYSLGVYYTRNELIPVFLAGVSLARFIAPLLVLGAAASVASFFFEDGIVIPTFRAKSELSRKLLGQTVSYSNTNVTITSADRRIVYQATHYNDRLQRLTGVTIVERDSEGGFVARVEAELGEWNGSYWVLRNCRVFHTSGEGRVEETVVPEYHSTRFDERPVIFRRMADRVEEMRAGDARRYVEALRRAGLPYQEALSWLHRKYSFAATPFVVTLIAGSVGGLFKRNVLFLSLLASLGITVGYYVLQLAGLTLARAGLLAPITGAWMGVAVFLASGVGLLHAART